jgi:hypothetical protein
LAAPALANRGGADAEAGEGSVGEREHAPLYTGQVQGSTLVAEMKMNLDKTQVARRQHLRFFLTISTPFQCIPSHVRVANLLST